jgi:hypothetical protein
MIYVASSWRNGRQPEVVKALEADGHEVYDFRNPEDGNYGFHWSEIRDDWKDWTPEQYMRFVLEHPLAAEGFAKDMQHLDDCQICILVQPCGISAHLELGYAVGAGKLTSVLLDENGFEPELMYKMVDNLSLSIQSLKTWVDMAT